MNNTEFQINSKIGAYGQRTTTKIHTSNISII